MQLVKKINLGSGSKIINGWENYDKNKSVPEVLYIDLLEKFPFKENSIDFVFSEHVIEHFDELDGWNILNKIYKVMKKGSVFRFSTPSLDTYIKRFLYWDDFFNENHKKTFKSRTRFINFAFLGEYTSGIKYLDGKRSTCDGHKFIYSYEDLFLKLSEIGFSKVYRVKHMESKFSELRGIDTHPDWEDLIIEAIK